MQHSVYSFSSSVKDLSAMTLSSPIVPNVVVFGEAGAGKTSVVKGDNTAAVSSKAKGGTLSNTLYVKHISGSHFHLFDTAGLNEGTGGTVSEPQSKGCTTLYVPWTVALTSSYMSCERHV